MQLNEAIKIVREAQQELDNEPLSIEMQLNPAEDLKSFLEGSWQWYYREN